MDLLAQLWMPVLLSALGVWMASALGWMLLGHHGKDWDALPDEARSMDTLRSMNLPAGSYGFPYMSHKEAGTPEGKAKWERGPMGLLRIWKPANMGLNMIKTAVFFLIVSVLIAYLGSACLTKGAAFAKVFQVLGTAGVLAYSCAFIPGDIWFQAKPRSTIMGVLDGIAFGLITGAIFAWLWPR